MTYGLSDSKEIKRAEKWLSEYWNQPEGPEYFYARSLDEAVGLLREYGREARIIAGGTDLLGLIKNQVAAPRVFIDIKKIPDLRYIRSDEKGVTLGALTRINDLQRSDLIKTRYPALYETACSISSPQIRNMATVGGNLCQDVRCWYYRRSPDTGITYDCRRKGKASGCHAAQGENQYHAIMGMNTCLAVCGSDLATMLTALDARIETVSSKGGRSLPVDELYSPLKNNLEPDEVISTIRIPAEAVGTRQRWLKFRIRKAIDFAIVSAACVLWLDGDVVREARVVVGGVSYKPYRALKAEAILKGERITESLAAEAGKAAMSEAVPLSKNDYKVTIGETLVGRGIIE
jgi:xanthine dehydrogenase YagS FAD-binding subunit